MINPNKIAQIRTLLFSYVPRLAVETIALFVFKCAVVLHKDSYLMQK